MRFFLFVLLLVNCVSVFSSYQKESCIRLGLENVVTGQIFSEVSCSIGHVISDDVFKPGNARFICATEYGRKVINVRQSESGTSFFDLGTGAYELVQFSTMKFSTTIPFGNGSFFESLGKFTFGLFNVKAFDLDQRVDHDNGLTLYYTKNGQVMVNSSLFSFSGVQNELYDLSVLDLYLGKCR